MPWNRLVTGWIVITALVTGAAFYAHAAGRLRPLPAGEIEPLAESPEANRYAGLRAAAAVWAHELDHAAAGLEEQAVVEAADARQARALRVRVRVLGIERERVLKHARTLARSPAASSSRSAQLEGFAAWLRSRVVAAPEVSRDTAAWVMYALEPARSTAPEPLALRPLAAGTVRPEGGRAETLAAR